MGGLFPALYEGGWAADGEEDGDSCAHEMHEYQQKGYQQTETVCQVTIHPRSNNTRVGQSRNRVSHTNLYIYI